MSFTPQKVKRSNSGISNYFGFHCLGDPNTYIYEMVATGKVRWTHYFTGHCINTHWSKWLMCIKFWNYFYLLNYRLDTPLRHLYFMRLHAQCTQIELFCGRFIFMDFTFSLCVEIKFTDSHFIKICDKMVQILDLFMVDLN